MFQLKNAEDRKKDTNEVNAEVLDSILERLEEDMEAAESAGIPYIKIEINASSYIHFNLDEILKEAKYDVVIYHYDKSEDLYDVLISWDKTMAPNVDIEEDLDSIHYDYWEA